MKSRGFVPALDQTTPSAVIVDDELGIHRAPPHTVASIAAAEPQLQSQAGELWHHLGHGCLVCTGAAHILGPTHETEQVIFRVRWKLEGPGAQGC